MLNAPIHRSPARAVEALISEGDFAALGRKFVEKATRRRPKLPVSLAVTPRPRRSFRASADRERPVIWMVGPNLEREGAPLSQFELACGLAGMGLDVEVQAPADGPLRARYVEAGITLRIRPELVCSPTVPKWYEADVRRLARLLEHERPDLLLVSTIDSFAAVDAASMVGVPTIWNIRESETWRERLADRHPDIAARALAAIGYCEALAFVAESSRESWGQFTTPDRTHVIHNAAHPGIRDGLREPGEADRIRAMLGAREDDTVVVAIGPLCPRKGQLDLMRAMRLIPPERLARMLFVFIGRAGARYAGLVERSARAAPSARVVFLGEVDDAARYAAAADVLVNTSRSEAFPRTFLEAAAGGTAIVATSVDGASERLVCGLSGMLFPPGDVSALADHLQRLLDPALRARLTVEARAQLIGEWTYEQMTAAYADLVEVSLARRPSLPESVGAPVCSRV